MENSQIKEIRFYNESDNRKHLKKFEGMLRAYSTLREEMKKKIDKSSRLAFIVVGIICPAKSLRILFGFEYCAQLS